MITRQIVPVNNGSRGDSAQEIDAQTEVLVLDLPHEFEVTSDDRNIADECKKYDTKPIIDRHC